MNDPLYGNKIAAALLVVLLLAVGLPVVVGTFTELGEHIGAHGEDHAGVEGCPEGVVFAPFDCSAIGVASEADAGPTIPFVNLLAEADPARGERAAAICSSCHSFEKGGPNGTGPHLWDVVGRDIASVSGFSYTSALEGLEGDWDYEALDPFLANSQSYVPGTQMAQRIRNDQKRADIIAYLGTLSDDPLPLPEPVAVEEPSEGGESEEGAAAEGPDTAEGEAAEAAADQMDFDAPDPGDATRSDESEVNNPGDDGFPGDEARTGSDYSSSDEDGAEIDGQETDAGFRDEPATQD